MSNLARPLDPEFQRVYDEATGKQAHDAEVVQKNETPAAEEDGFQSFARMAKEQLEERGNKPAPPIGSFDHFEQGVSNTIRLGWNWLTR